MAGYHVYLGKTLLPVAPDKITMKINGKNAVYDLINEGEMNVLKLAGLTTVSFSILLPAVKYPFATYHKGFKNTSYYLEILEKLKQNKKPFQFIVTRTDKKITGRKRLHNTNMKVSLEDFTIKEDAQNQGFDLTVDINLKQFKERKTKTFKVKKPKPTSPIAVAPQRPEPESEGEGQQSWTVIVWWCGSSGAVQKVSGYSTISLADARKKAWAKVPKNALHASENKSQVHL